MSKLTELMALSEKATQGNWLPYFHEVVIDERWQECCGNRIGEQCCMEPEVVGDYFQICEGVVEADMSFIAAAINFLRSTEFGEMVKNDARYRLWRKHYSSQFILCLPGATLRLDKRRPQVEIAGADYEPKVDAAIDRHLAAIDSQLHEPQGDGNG